MIRIFCLLPLLLTLSCDISAVNYAVDDVAIVDKTKVVVDQHPAVKITLRNGTDGVVYDVKVTVKAKKNQRDLDRSIMTLRRMSADKIERSTLIFEHLKDHEAYDFLTFAVSFSRTPQATDQTTSP